MNAETSIRFLAIVDDRLLNNIESIADALTEKGLVVDRIRKFTGTISGSAANMDVINDTHISGVEIMPEQEYMPYV